jgi:hypothetical protein
MWPVFVFGTGRCGSTHVQRIITLSTSCWIWGEHEGFLEPLLDSVRRYGRSELLDRTAFRFAEEREDHFIAEMAQGSDRLSWLNRFKREEFQTEVALLIDRMFRSHVPNGWTQWGFKEIRYGFNNDAPQVLLNLFPAATAIFTFREPSRTIQSMIRAWGRPGLLDDEAQSKNFCDTYTNCARVWATVVEYFCQYRQNEDKRIWFLSDDKLNRPTDRLLETLAIPRSREISKNFSITNVGPKKWPMWANRKFEELFSKDETKLKDLYIRSCTASDADFE